MNEVLFEILKAAVVLVVVILVRYAAPYLRMKVEETQCAWIIKWAEIAVKSAEQTITGDGSNKEKKAIVTKLLKSMLIKKNISISDEQLDSLIEAAVFEMKQGKYLELPSAIAVGSLSSAEGEILV
ncbi:MAG: phage holin [Lachnospiraceae bacterium]|nr:phage holin [Lachnospiraceae bacterium]